MERDSRGGWYSNRARGERAKHEAETGSPDTADVEVIDVSEYHLEPCFDDPFPDYDSEPVMAYANDPDFAA